MAQVAIKEALLRELDGLPEDKTVAVLDFVRFLKSREEEDLERRFTLALEEARKIATQRGITETDILAEIKAVRAE